MQVWKLWKVIYNYNCSLVTSVQHKCFLTQLSVDSTVPAQNKLGTPSQCWKTSPLYKTAELSITSGLRNTLRKTAKKMASRQLTPVWRKSLRVMTKQCKGRWGYQRDEWWVQTTASLWTPRSVLLFLGFWGTSPSSFLLFGFVFQV